MTENQPLHPDVLQPVPDLFNNDPSTMAGSRLVHDVGDEAVAVAQWVVDQPEFNYGSADLLMRNLAALTTYADADDLDALEPAEKQSLAALAADSLTALHGDNAQAELEANLAAYRPFSEAEAFQQFLSMSFNGIQQRLIRRDTDGTFGGVSETDMRHFTLEYAQAFKSLVFGLHANGCRRVNDSYLRYMIGNIRGAMPRELRQIENDENAANTTGGWSTL